MNRLEELAKKRAFIYKINEKYYILGNGVFKECTNYEAIYIHTEYQKAINNGDEEQLLKCYRDIRKYSRRHKEEHNKDASNNIIDLISKSNNKQRLSMQEQLDDFVETYQKSKK